MELGQRLVTDHQRHGILGAHVRVMIYNGSWEDPTECAYTAIPDVICSITFYCTNLQHIVLWRINFGTCIEDWPRTTDFADRYEPSGLPIVPALTVMDSVVREITMYVPPFYQVGTKLARYRLARKVDHWSVMDSRLALPPPTSQELAWIIKHACDLPARYHDWDKRALLNSFNTSTGQIIGFPEFSDFRNLKADGITDRRLWLILALFIVVEKVYPSSDPPPASLELDLMSEVPREFFQ